MKIKKRIQEVLVKPISWSKVNPSKEDKPDKSLTYGYYEDQYKTDQTLTVWGNGQITVYNTQSGYPYFNVDNLIEEREDTTDMFFRKPKVTAINLFGKSNWNISETRDSKFDINKLAKVKNGNKAIISMLQSNTHYYCLDLEINAPLLLYRIEKFESPNLKVRTRGNIIGMEEDNISFIFENAGRYNPVYKKLTVQ
jgi:hypothetical protein